MHLPSGAVVHRLKKTEAQRQRDAERVAEYWAIVREKFRRTLKSVE